MIKRLCELNVNDCFEWGWLTYVVTKKSKKNGIVFTQCRIVDGIIKNAGGIKSSYGLNCQMKVRMVAGKRSMGFSKAVQQLDNYGNVIKTFPSIMSASRSIGIDHNGISNCINGRGRKSAGYGWRLKVA